jgi:hypothetical protein
MGHLANILDFQAVRRPKLASAAFAAPHIGYSDLARLIPGASNSVRSASTSPPILKTVAMHILPRFCHKFDAGMLAPAMLDLALITLVFAFEPLVLGSRSLHQVALCVYVLSFLFFALEEDLYLSRKTALSENAAACRAVAWATLFRRPFSKMVASAWFGNHTVCA